MKQVNHFAVFKLTLPIDLKKSMKEKAAINKHSLSAEIIARLYRSLAREHRGDDVHYVERD